MFKKWWFWVLIVVGLLILVAIGIFIYKQQSKPVEQPVLTVNFIDISKVDKISKFRSCQGHAVIPQDGSETKRNMKHYVVLKPEFIGTGKVPVYSPFDGIVQSLRSEPSKGLEGEIGLGVKGSEWGLSILHINILADIREGQKIKAGEILGYAVDKGVDVVYSAGGDGITTVDGWGSPYGALDSAFSHMSNGLLAVYQSRGLNEDDFIYTKEFRDQNPCRYIPGGQNAQLNDFEHPEDWVFLR